MKIKLKWILTAAVAIFAGLIITGYAILSALNLDDLRGAIEAKARQATGRDLRIGGPIELELSFSPAIAIQEVSFGNAPWGAWPELFSVRRLEVAVGLLPLLTGEIEVRELVAIEPTILLETNAEGQGNWVIGESGAAAGDGAGDGPAKVPAFNRIEIREGRLIFRDGHSGEETLFSLHSFDAWADTPASPTNVTLEGAYNGVEIAAAGTLGSRDDFLGGADFPIDARIETGGTTLAVEGTLGDLATLGGLDLQAELRGPSLAEIGPLVGVELPPLGPYSLSGRLSDVEGGIEIAGLAATLGESDFAGTTTIRLEGSRPTIAAALSAGALDLKDFTGPETGPRPETERLFPDRPLPLDDLLSFDARVTLSAEQARFDATTMVSELSLVFDLNLGKLTISDLAGTLSGGTLRGNLSLDAAAAEPPATLEISAKGFDYGHFLQGRDITDGVDGKLDAEIRLRATGASPHAWAKSLNGRVALTGGEGRVRSDLLSASGAGLIDMVSAWREGDNDLKLNCVVMRLPVEGGVMKTEAVLIDTAAVTVGVRGEVDLGAETLDLKVTPQAKQTSLISLAVPLRVGGTLAAPSVSPDALGTAIGAAKIAGMFLNPLIAGAAIIIESETADQNPCVAAIEGKSGARAPSKGQAAPSLNQGLKNPTRD